MTGEELVGLQMGFEIRSLLVVIRSKHSTDFAQNLDLKDLCELQQYSEDSSKHFRAEY